MEQRICKKCLTRDMKEVEYFKNLYIYIQNLNPDIKSSEREYKDRLEFCRDCNFLQNGMCKVCGCFVELRAAVAANHCPGTKKLW